jgi:hypothetical protein
MVIEKVLRKLPNNLVLVTEHQKAIHHWVQFVIVGILRSRTYLYEELLIGKSPLSSSQASKIL